MKNLSKFAAVTGAATMVAAISLSPVLAESPGQLEGGPVYQVKDVTQSGGYASSISGVACGDVLEYSVNLHNTEFGQLTDIEVSATLSGNGSSSITATPSSKGTTGTSGSVSVSGAGSSVSYNGGSTKLFAGGTESSLSDGITSGGIDVGNLNGSTGEFVNFEATVNCPATPVTTASVTPTALPQTGADELTGLAGMAGSGAIGYGAVMYRRSKKALADKMLGRK